jgi:hypothetical protein
VKLFQIEEPDGGPPDPSAPGAAVGIDASSAEAEVAVSVGGNAVVLADREGLQQVLSVPGTGAAKSEWRQLFEAAKVRAERALARPVTHAVIVLGELRAADPADDLRSAAEEAGLEVLQFTAKLELPAGTIPVLGAALLAEDLAPRFD